MFIVINNVELKWNHTIAAFFTSNIYKHLFKSKVRFAASSLLMFLFNPCWLPVFTVMCML